MKETRGGLSMVIDPRWIVAVPENDDVAVEVARQMGPAPQGVDAGAWAALGAAVTAMLGAALEAGARWTGAWYAVDQSGTLVLTRATLAISEPIATGDGSLGVERLLDETVVAHRDDDYRAEIGLVSTALGAAVAHRQIVVLDDGEHGEDRLGDHASLTWITDDAVVDLRAFSTQVGWAGIWYPQLEAMAQTLRVDPDTLPGVVTMVAYVVDDESVPR